MRRIDLYISKVQFAKLQALVKKTGLCFSELVRRAIDDFLKGQK